MDPPPQKGLVLGRVCFFSIKSRIFGIKWHKKFLLDWSLGRTSSATSRPIIGQYRPQTSIPKPTFEIAKIWLFWSSRKCLRTFFFKSKILLQNGLKTHRDSSVELLYNLQVLPVHFRVTFDKPGKKFFFSKKRSIHGSTSLVTPVVYS